MLNVAAGLHLAEHELEAIAPHIDRAYQARVGGNGGERKQQPYEKQQQNHRSSGLVHLGSRFSLALFGLAQSILKRPTLRNCEKKGRLAQVPNERRSRFKPM